MGKTYRKGDHNFKFDDGRFEQERNISKQRKKAIEKEKMKRKRQIDVEDDE